MSGRGLGWDEIIDGHDYSNDGTYYMSPTLPLFYSTSKKKNRSTWMCFQREVRHREARRGRLPWNKSPLFKQCSPIQLRTKQSRPSIQPTTIWTALYNSCWTDLKKNSGYLPRCNLGERRLVGWLQINFDQQVQSRGPIQFPTHPSLFEE